MFRSDPAKFDTQYSQDHLPVRQQHKVVGHGLLGGVGVINGSAMLKPAVNWEDRL